MWLVFSIGEGFVERCDRGLRSFRRDGPFVNDGAVRGEGGNQVGVRVVDAIGEAGVLDAEGDGEFEHAVFGACEDLPVARRCSDANGTACWGKPNPSQCVWKGNKRIRGSEKGIL